MNYDIKLYAHGVPKGQRTWGVAGYDNNYIESFYGRKSDVSVQMLVEVKQFGSKANCYYTYLRLDNIKDSSGRAGSYFALTLRLNYYYADILNMYNLLDAAYKKFITGTILETANDGSRYLISDFAQSNKVLTDLEEEIKKYLMQFSKDSDFVPLSGFKANSMSGADSVYLLDCEGKNVANHVKANGNISVSPLYPSSREQRTIQKMKDEIMVVNANAKQQIVAVQQKAQTDIQNIQSQTTENIKAARRERDEGIQTAQKELKLALQYKDMYGNAQFQLEEANKKLEGIRYILGQDVQVRMPGMSRARHSSPHADIRRNWRSEEEPADAVESKSLFMKAGKKKIYLISVIIIVLVIIGGVLACRKTCSPDSNSDKKNARFLENTEQVENVKDGKDSSSCIPMPSGETDGFKNKEDGNPKGKKSLLSKCVEWLWR